jgi:hypothetical protein
MASKKQTTQQPLLDEDQGALAPAEPVKVGPTANEAYRSRMLVISFSLMCIVGVGNRCVDRRRECAP